MKTAPDRPTRIAADLIEAATIEGARSSRSAKQQLDHWARVGRAVSMSHSAARQRVEAALAGQLPERDLTSDERSVFNAELDASLAEAARQVSFGKLLRGRGITTVAIDADGRLIRHHPDGTTSQLT